MADTQYTLTLNDADQAMLVRLTDERNTAVPLPPDVLSPSQFLRQHVREWIRSQAGRFLEKDQIGLRTAYNAATPTEQATIDAILAPYRT